MLVVAHLVLRGRSKRWNSPVSGGVHGTRRSVMFRVREHGRAAPHPPMWHRPPRPIRPVTRLTGVNPYLTVGGAVLAGILLFVAGMAVRWLVAPQAPTAMKFKTYECGVDPVGEGWAQTNVRYFLYAFLYVIFAVDAIYLFPWATIIRSADLGMASLAEMGIFIGVVLVGLAHAARRGLLRWV
jgi:NADH-quinone oxidoreductase subunit A